MPFAEGLIRLAEDAANRLLRQDPDTLDRLAALDGKTVRLVLSDVPAALVVRPFGGGLRLDSRWADPVDVTLRGPARAFVRLLARRGDHRVLFEGLIQVDGEVDAAQRLQRALAGLDVDWEAVAARWLGEAPARELGRGLRGLAEWLGEAGRTLALDLAEYLREERRELVGPETAARFAEQVDTLRLDVERAAQRVQRLLDRTAP